MYGMVHVITAQEPAAMALELRVAVAQEGQLPVA